MISQTPLSFEETHGTDLSDEELLVADLLLYNEGVATNPEFPAVVHNIKSERGE